MTKPCPHCRSEFCAPYAIRECFDAQFARSPTLGAVQALLAANRQWTDAAEGERK